jgi:hypothetical protein
MAGEQGTFFRTEIDYQIIDETNADVEQLAIASGTIIRDAGL